MDLLLRLWLIRLIRLDIDRITLRSGIGMKSTRF